MNRLVLEFLGEVIDAMERSNGEPFGGFSQITLDRLREKLKDVEDDMDLEEFVDWLDAKGVRTVAE